VNTLAAPSARPRSRAERADQDRDRVGEQHRRAERLEGASGDEGRRRECEATEAGAGDEDRKADEEDALVAAQIAEAAEREPSGAR
jgi:hypothetical protein